MEWNLSALACASAGDDNVAPAGPDFTFKREGGQLLLVRIPGG